ncbi:DUF937 domain-containing protein [Kovacikia minuta CCNUW1]|uniref:DUF937 domain-containing protein n=1 Tax=Kovacikia minuta TaxID=2931930 RepID=UPI001CCC6EF4|nr:DUF937 domain-containing protein [Kovacikia minuta]UBF26350.1 DUF937 domain-containing protein [Kovacikia minuta CCNUW1]
MSVFFEILSAINNPNQQGSIDQLSQVVHSVQQLGAEQGISSSTLQTVLSSLGGLLAPALKQQGAVAGGLPLDNLTELAGAGMGAGVLSSFLTPELQQQIVQAIAQKTGLPAGTLQSLLPGLISAVTGFLSMGAGKSGVPGSNPVLSAFLDSDRDGDIDLGDAFKFATRFLNAPG